MATTATRMCSNNKFKQNGKTSLVKVCEFQTADYNILALIEGVRESLVVVGRWVCTRTHTYLLYI